MSPVFDLSTMAFGPTACFGRGSGLVAFRERTRVLDQNDLGPLTANHLFDGARATIPDPHSTSSAPPIDTVLGSRFAPIAGTLGDGSHAALMGRSDSPTDLISCADSDCLSRSVSGTRPAVRGGEVQQNEASPVPHVFVDPETAKLCAAPIVIRDGHDLSVAELDQQLGSEFVNRQRIQEPFLEIALALNRSTREVDR